MTLDQKICAGLLAVVFFLGADLMARGAASLFGQYFFWLVSVLA